MTRLELQASYDIQAAEILALMQTDKISFQEWNRRQSALVNEYYSGIASL